MALHFFGTFLVLLTTQSTLQHKQAFTLTHTFKHWWQRLPCKLPPAHLEQQPFTKTLKHLQKSTWSQRWNLYSHQTRLFSHCCHPSCFICVLVYFSALWCSYLILSQLQKSSLCSLSGNHPLVSHFFLSLPSSVFHAGFIVIIWYLCPSVVSAGVLIALFVSFLVHH